MNLMYVSYSDLSDANKSYFCYMPQQKQGLTSSCPLSASALKNTLQVYTGAKETTAQCVSGDSRQAWE